MQKLLCFEPQRAHVERMFAGYNGADMSPTGIASAADLKAQAAPGDILVIASAAPDHPPGGFFTTARAIGMAVWSLSDHWVKAETAPSTADGGEPTAE